MNGLFFKNKSYVSISRDKFESRESFNERGWFVCNRNPQTNQEYLESVRLSRIYVNVKLKGMKYSDDIMKLLSFSI